MSVKAKFNLRVVAVVLVVILFMVGGVVAKKFRGRIKSSNPQELSQRMDEAMAKKDFNEALRLAGELIKATDELKDASYRIRTANIYLSWMRDDPSLNASQRRDCLVAAVKQLRTATLIDPASVEAYRQLCDLYWHDAIVGGGISQFIESADAVLKLKKDPEVFYRRGYAKMRVSETDTRIIDSGLNDLKEAVTLDGGVQRYWLGGPDPMTHAILPGYLFFINKYGTADIINAAFEDALKALPNNGDMRVAYGMYLMSRDMKDQALAQFVEVAKLEPGNPSGNLELAEYYLKQKKMDDALRCAQAAMSQNQDDFRCYIKLAKVSDLMNKADESLDILRQGIKRIVEGSSQTPTSAGSYSSVWMDKRLAASELYFTLGNLLLDRYFTSRSAPLMEEARSCRKGLGEIFMDGYEYNQLAGRLALMEGDLSEATTCLQKAFDSRPAEPQVAVLLFDAYVQAGLPGKADTVLKTMEKMQTYQGSQLLMRFRTILAILYRDYAKAASYIAQLSSTGQGDEWVQQMSWVLAVAAGKSATLPKNVVPSLASIYILRDCATRLWAKEDRSRAVAILEDLNSRVPTNVDVAIQLSRAYGGTRQPEKARAILEKAISADPNNKRLAGEWQLAVETDPEKQFDARLALTDGISDPLARAIARADLCEFHNRKDLCLKYLQEARALAPDNPIVLDKVFNFAIKIRDFDLAGKCVDAATAGDIDKVGGVLYRGKFEIAQGQFDKAIASLNDVLARRPEMKEARTLLGDCYIIQYQKDRQPKMLSSAYDAYKAVLGIDPTYPQALVGIAMVTELQGNYQEHANWVQIAWENCPENPYIRDEYLQLQRSSGDPAELIRICESVLSRNPDNVKNIHTLARLYEDHRILRLADAERMYQLFYEKSDNKLAAASELVGFLVRVGKSADAEALFTQLRQTEKDQVGVLVLYGQYLSPTNPQLAEDAFRKAIETDPKDMRGYNLLALFYSMQRDWKKTAGVIEKLLEVYPNNLVAKKNLIQAYIHDGQFDQARKMVDSILSADPEDIEAVFCQGLIHAGQMQYVEAEQKFRKTLTINPRFIPAMQSLARVAVSQGCNDRAISWLTDAAKMANNPLVSCELAAAYDRIGQFGRAEQICKEVLLARKDFLPAIRLLKDLYMKTGNWDMLAQLLATATTMFPMDMSLLLAESRLLAAQGNNRRRVLRLEHDLTLLPKSPELAMEYVAAMFDDGQYDKLLAYAAAYNGNKQFVPLMDAARAAATLKKAPGKIRQADELFASAIASADPRFLQVVFDWMYKVYGPGQIVSQEERWLKARPDEPQLLNVIGMAYGHCGTKNDYKNAVGCMERAVKLAVDPERKAFYRANLAGMYQRMGDIRGAEEIYLEHLATVPSNVINILNNLAYLYVDSSGEPEKALPLIHKAYRLAPENADIMDTYAWTLARLGRYDDADGVFAILMQLTNQPAVAYYHAGYVREALGKTQDALKYYNTGLEKVSKVSSDEQLKKTLADAVNRLKR